MRSILEKAIVHLLNEEQDQAEKLFHKFMVEKARRIHESLRSGEVVLAEGWDDEITSEEYMSEDDLESVEDHNDADAEMSTDDASDDLSDDLGVEGDGEGDDSEVEMDDSDAEMDDAEAEGDDAEAEMDDSEAEEGEGTEEERITDLEDQIEKLTAEFDQMMSEIDGGDEDGLGDDMGDDMGDDDGMGDEHMGDEDGMGDDMGGEDDGMGDGMDSEGGDDMADRMEDDVTDEEHDAHDEMAEGEFDDDSMMEGKKKGLPPWLKKKEKKPVKEVAKKPVKKDDKKGKKDEVCEDDEDLDDITESVMAELEKISVSMEDGKEVATGKKITTNDKSPLIQASVDKRGGAKPVTIKGPTHQGYEREAAPGNKTLKKGKNTVSGKADSVLSKVPAKGDASALINKDYAGDKNNNKSPVVPTKSTTN